MLINIDLKQIEVCVFAQLCKDPLLIQLLTEGKDIHRYIGGQVHNKAEDQVTKEERKDIKAGTFGIIYGNGAKKLSETVNKELQWCKDFIEQFYDMFIGAKKWHTEIINAVEETGQLTLFTGMTLKFPKYPARYSWQDPTKMYYNPPDIKNWPVQHLAFMITSLILGAFFRQKALHNRDKYLLINTVHDSIMLDCREEFVDNAIKDLLEIVDKVPEYVLSLWNEKLLVPIKVDVSVGNNWLEL